MNPLVRSVSLTLDRPSPADKRADRERLISRLLEETVIDSPVEIDLGILREISSFLRENDWKINVTVGYRKDAAQVIAFNHPTSYAVALDIGTTNIAASLLDLGTQGKIASQEQRNPQTVVGLDVLTRIFAAMGGRREELHGLLIRGINDLLDALCRAHRITTSDIMAVTIAGNTIMTHFLLNLAVDYIPVEPYLPVAHRIDFIRPDSIGLKINPQGIVYVFPNAGSYVGGDIISGILSSGLYREKDPAILVDVGTNAEIVLGCDEWIVVGAGAAGPALEGGISEIGMGASEGAIYSVEIKRDDHEVVVRTIGDREPLGICGSGMIELVSELYTTGIVDRQGKFTETAWNVAEINGRKGFVLYDSGGRRLIIKDTEIDNFLRSKAAMFTALYVTVKSVGLRFADVRKMYVSGAFGMGIDVDKAIRIGMIPRMGRERFLPIGNSSLRGAEMVLLNRHLLSDIDRICEVITYKEMNTDRDFMAEFPGALFIPHTNPSVLEA